MDDGHPTGTPRVGAVGTAVALALFGVLMLAGFSLIAAPGGTADTGGTGVGSHTAATLGAAAAARGRFFGVAVDGVKIDGDARYAAIVDREFSSVTPENAMQWDALEPERGRFSFQAADRIVAHARANGLRIRGYPLVSPEAAHLRWVQELTSPVTARSALVDHVTGIVRHYRGRVDTWDVVSDAYWDADGGPRQWILRAQLGPGYVEEAFVAARAADPDAMLCYNDHHVEDLARPKTQAVYAMVKDFRARGVPIDCVGLESHFDSGYPVPETFQRTIEQFAALGVEVHLTQLDVTQPDAPVPGGTQAEQYARAVGACLAVARCTGITVWAVRDQDSWRAAGTPALFDHDGNRKPAYLATLAALVDGGST